MKAAIAMLQDKLAWYREGLKRAVDERVRINAMLYDNTLAQADCRAKVYELGAAIEKLGGSAS